MGLDPYTRWERGAELHRRGGDPRTIEAAYRDAIAGGWDDAWLHLALLLLLQPKRWDEAEAAFERVLETGSDPYVGRAAIELANLLAAQQRWERVPELHQRALTKGGEGVRKPATRLVAWDRAAAGDFAVAEALFRTSALSWFGGKQPDDARDAEDVVSSLMSFARRPRGLAMLRRQQRRILRTTVHRQRARWMLRRLKYRFTPAG